MKKREIVIIGGGPAGLAAAIEAAKLGAKVTLLDENNKPGGQLFKQIHKFFGSHAHNAGVRGVDIGNNLLAKTEELGVEVILKAEVLNISEDKVVTVKYRGIGQEKAETIQAQRILIATGASENAVNFPGWTLPGVMGAGAAQTMINVNRVLPGKRVLMIGSGNVGLIVTYQLLQAGADVVGIVEAMGNIGGYGVHASKVSRAGVPFYLGHTIVKAEAADDGKVSAAVIAKLDEKFNVIAGTESRFSVDCICIAVGLRPLSELAHLSGVRHDFIPELGGFVPLHDENMETSVGGIYIAGDTAGVEEANTAMDEGRLAGVSMAQSLNYVSEADGEHLKSKIKESLTMLRQGPFGQKRLNAKARILAKYGEVGL